MSRRNRASVSRFPKSTIGWTCWTAILSQRSTPRSYDAASFSRQRSKLDYWDAAIIAAAQRLGARILYTEDLNHDQLYGSVRVMNPFRPN